MPSASINPAENECLFSMLSHLLGCTDAEMPQGSALQSQTHLTQKKSIQEESREGPTGDAHLDAELESLEAHTKVRLTLDLQMSTSGSLSALQVHARQRSSNAMTLQPCHAGCINTPALRSRRHAQLTGHDLVQAPVLSPEVLWCVCRS